LAREALVCGSFARGALARGAVWGGGSFAGASRLAPHAPQIRAFSLNSLPHFGHKRLDIFPIPPNIIPFGYSPAKKHLLNSIYSFCAAIIAYLGEFTAKNRKSPHKLRAFWGWLLIAAVFRAPIDLRPRVGVFGRARVALLARLDPKFGGHFGVHLALLFPLPFAVAICHVLTPFFVCCIYSAPGGVALCRSKTKKNV
jgi:hypothetical protein